MISSIQAVLARTMVQMSQKNVAEALGWAHQTLSKIEKGDVNPPVSRINELQGFYENAGVEFIDGDGVRRRPDNIVMVYEGFDGFDRFKADVRKTASKGGEGLDICISNVDEKQFVFWGTEAKSAEHRKFMSGLKNLQCRILAHEGDNFLVATGYAQYKWLPQELYGSIPFYIYGSKTAIISFEADSVKVFVIDHQPVTDFYRKQFKRLWDFSQNVE